MAAKITSLTSEQSARLPEFRDRWTAIGLSTERADRPRAEAGVRQAYKAAGLEPPSLIIWRDSPTAGAIGAAILSGTVRESVGESVRESVGDQTWRAIYGQHDANWLGFYEFRIAREFDPFAEQARQVAD